MYYSYVEIEYVAMIFFLARTDLALKLLSKRMIQTEGGESIRSLMNLAAK
jgi:hypothetical protein